MFQRQTHQSSSQQNINRCFGAGKLQNRESSLQASDCRLIDESYFKMRKQIVESTYLRKVSKHLQIRVRLWVKKLDKTSSNSVWKKNRNNYLKLLLLMIQCQYITLPFTALPPYSDIPHLSKHQQTQIIDEVEREVKQSAFRSSSIIQNFNSKLNNLETFPEDQSSFYLRNFIQIAENSNAYAQQDKMQKSSLKNYKQDKQFSPQIEFANKQNTDINKKVKRSIISLKPSQVSQIVTSAGPSYRLHNQSKPSQFFSKNQRIKTTYVQPQDDICFTNFEESVDNSLSELNESKQYDFNNQIDQHVENHEFKSTFQKQNRFNSKKTIEIGFKFLLKHHQTLKDDETYKQLCQSMKTNSME